MQSSNSTASQTNTEAQTTGSDDKTSVATKPVLRNEWVEDIAKNKDIVERNACQRRS